MREIDRRIRYLQKRIPEVSVIDRRADSDTIFFGAEVELLSGNDNMVIRIVGADEIKPAHKHISIDSPLARALLKKQMDDEVSIQVDGKTFTYCVVSVRYPVDD